MSNRKNNLLLELVNNLALICLVLIFVIPFLWMLFTSFKTLQETIANPPIIFPEGLRFENYLQAWEKGNFSQYTINSIVVTGVTMFAQLLFVVPAAYGFARFEFLGKNFFFGIVMVTLMIPVQLIFIPLYLLFADLGLINNYLSLILPYISSAFGIFLLRQTFLKVPSDLVGAAKIDQANEFQILTKIYLPIAKPTIITILLLTFISRWNDYFWPLVMTTNEKVRTLSVGVTSLAVTEGSVSWHIIMAANVILVIPILILYLLAQKQIIGAYVSTEER